MDRALKHLKNIPFGVDDFDHIFKIVNPVEWMLVCDKSFDFLPNRIKQLYCNHKNNCVVFNDFESNPKYESVVKGIHLLSEHDISLIVAIGGGSTIDVAKCIKLYSGLNNNELLLKQNINYDSVSKINLIALPTTAGTGSESTKHAVIYYNGVKQSICDDEIVPDVVILDAVVLEKLPPIHKKAAMLDALCQACESWWSRSSTSESAFYSSMAISGIVDQWEPYLSGDSHAADNILRCANLAGRAINLTKTTAPHAMSYKLSSLYNLPHGIAVALCFPIVWRHMLKKADDELMKTFDLIALAFHAFDIESAIKQFEAMLVSMNIRYPHSETRDNDINILVESVNPERLSNNPIQFNKEELREMYEEIVR